MSEIQQVEIHKLRPQITQDVRKLVEKYRKIMDWDVPENNEARARKLILQEIRTALDKMEQTAP